jgi:hypothetical protein
MDGHFQKACGIRHECLRHIGCAEYEKCGLGSPDEEPPTSASGRALEEVNHPATESTQ